MGGSIFTQARMAGRRASTLMNNGETRKTLVVAITGASGAAYAKRLIECLCHADVDVHLVVTPHGRQLFHDELGLTEVSQATLLEAPSPRLTQYAYRDVGARIASGSFRTDAMIICPCSANTLGAVANGLADNLVHRAASVTLKEARRLIMVVREMPLSPIDLENAQRLSRAGAIICPASPGFYLKPTSVGDLVDFVVAKILDLVNVPHELVPRWEGESQVKHHAVDEVTQR